MSEQDQNVAQRYSPLYSRFYQDELVKREPPMLAHYTSLEAAEKMLASHELWFSNPLFMNDWEEMRFGIIEGVALLERTDRVREALVSDARIQKFKTAFVRFYEHLDKVQLLDTYVFCFSEHQKDNQDGLLSMWRGYGGHGRGAALIFDTSKMSFVPGAPMYLCRVEYGSREERIATLETLLRMWAQITRQIELPDGQIAIAAYNALSVIKFYSLVSKHWGFREEQEWRVIHIADHDPLRRLEPRFSYALTTQGVGPKLKFHFERHSAGNYPEQSFGQLLHTILLGPSVSSPLTRMAFIRMLKNINRPEYSDRVRASSIPLRPRST
jgi:hypothetical protein